MSIGWEVGGIQIFIPKLGNTGSSMIIFLKDFDDKCFLKCPNIGDI